MKKKILALALACVFALSFALVGCGGGSSSSADTGDQAASSSQATESEGGVSNMVTNSTSSSSQEGMEGIYTGPEAGSIQSLETSASVADPTGLREVWPDYFTQGAEGVNSNGEHFYFAFDDPNNITVATLMITSPDGSDLSLYVLGEASMQTYEEYFNGQQCCVIHDVEDESDLPFAVQQASFGNYDFDMLFIDDDVAHMTFVDQDTIINDMITIWENVQSGSMSYSAGA